MTRKPPVQEHAIKDLLGLKKQHRLQREFCLGENEDLTSGQPCEHYANRRCGLMETGNVSALKESRCTWSLLVIAVNDIWDRHLPFLKEIAEKDVLEALEKATLSPPTIDALFRLMRKHAWRSANRGRSRKVCRNCRYYLPKSRRCERAPDLALTADSRCAALAFQPRDPDAHEKLCGHCRWFLSGKSCELGVQTRVSAHTGCKKDAFVYIRPERTELTEIVSEPGMRNEAALDVAKVLLVLRDNGLRARRGSYQETRYQRLHELVIYLRNEQCSIAQAAEYFSEVWGVTKATVRNYIKEIARLIKIERAMPKS